MASVFFNCLAKGRGAAASTDTMAAEKVNPEAVEAMKEAGLYINMNKQKLLIQGMLEGVNNVITTGCSLSEECPSLFEPAEDWGQDDPPAKPIEVVRSIGNEVPEKVFFWQR